MIVEKVLHNLAYVHKASDVSLSEIVNRCTTIFSKDNHPNFLINSKIIKDYKISMSTVIKNSILLLVSDGKRLLELTEDLKKKKIDVKHLVEMCTTTITNNIDLIDKNVKILEMYGFNLEELFKNKESYALLNIEKLNIKLDQFIETGLNEQIHNSEEEPGKKVIDLINKRISYAYNNKIPIWSIPMNDGRLIPNEKFLSEISEGNVPLFTKKANESFKSYIDNYDYVVTDPDISLLIAEHPILVAIDEGYRPAIYSDTPLALLKRKTELLIGKKLISRLKTYRVFNLLIAQGIDDNEALFHALTYNMTLEESECNNIRSIITAAEGVLEK